MVTCADYPPQLDFPHMVMLRFICGFMCGHMCWMSLSCVYCSSTLFMWLRCVLCHCHAVMLWCDIVHRHRSFG